MRIKLTVSYDGTSFCGWQKQKNGISVQQTLEEAVEKITGKKVKITGSGRTDAGVHAKGQVCHFDIECTLPPENYYKALNTVLPEDVKVIKSERAEDNFDACRRAKKKTYTYSVYESDVELPLLSRYALRIEKGVNIKAMKECAKEFIGEHDFKSFCASGSSIKTTVRTVYSFSVEEKDGKIEFTVCGNGFLYNMVRIMVGTLLKIGYGKGEKEDITKMLNGGSRTLGGKTIPAKGLTLISVEY